MYSFSFRKTALTLLMTTCLGFSANAQNDTNTVFKYEKSASFIKPIDVTEAFEKQGLFNMEQGSVTFRVNRVNYAKDSLFSLFGISNKNTTNKYLNFYLNRTDKDVFGVEIRNGNSLIDNRNLITSLPINNSDFRTLTYTFDKANSQINIYVDGQKVKTHNDSKFFADIEGLNTAFIGKTERDNPANYSSWQAKMTDIYYVDVVSDVLTEEQVKNKHQQILENHTEALSRGEAFGAFKTDKIHVFASGQEGAGFYRIPSLLTTKNGVTIAAVDKRYQHGSDWGNIDTAIRRSVDGGKTWEKDQVVIDLAQQQYGDQNAAFLIDPSMVQDNNSGRLFMLVDMFPETKGFPGISNTGAEGTGYKNIEGKSYRLLTDNNSNQYTVRENGVVYDEDNQPTDFRVIVEGKAEIGFKDLGDLYQGDNRLGNIFLQSQNEGNDTAPLKAKITSYLWLVHSDDDGKTWSSPKDITPQVKADWMRFLGTGPGNGIQLKNGHLVLPVYYTNSNNKQSAAVIISKDGGETWQRSESPTDRVLATQGGSRLLNNGSHEITESQVIELDNGDLKMFSRNSRGAVRISTSKNGGYTWKNEVELDDVLLDSYSQMSVIKYSKRINGKEYVIFANPHSDKAWNRVNGKVWLGEVQDDGSIEWKYTTTISPGEYSYNSLSELPNGEIGLLYEDNNTKSNYAKTIAFVRLNLQELLWKDNIIYRDSRDPEHKEFSYQTAKEEVFYKIGDGEMIKVGEGINNGHLVIDEGIATLNQQANAQGEKQAFASVTVNPNGTIRLGSADQMNYSQIYLNQGTLDVNGQSIQLDEQNNENTGLRADLINGNIVNHSTSPASLTYTLSGIRGIDGKLGDDKGKLDLVYQPTDILSSLSLFGDSILNRVDIKNGAMAYQADTQHQVNNMNVRTGANLYLFDDAKATLKNAHIEQDANIIISNNQGQTAQLQAETTGEGNLIKNGDGHLLLSGNYQHTGVSNLNRGSLELNGTLGGKSFYLAPNTTLSGNGKITAPAIWSKDSTITPSNASHTYIPNILSFNDVYNQGASVHLGIANTNDEMKTWQHDQLLIWGNLKTEQPIPVNLKLWGNKKGYSDTNNNGKYDVDEGISLIQVKGDGKLGQFELANIVSKDPNDLFNFTLVSVDKKMSYSKDNRFGEENSDYYDYRLQTQLVREDGTKVSPFIPFVEDSPKTDENITPTNSNVETVLPLPQENVNMAPTNSNVETVLPLPQENVNTTPTNSNIETVLPLRQENVNTAPTNSNVETVLPLPQENAQPARVMLTSRIPSYLVSQTAMLAQGNAVQQQFNHNLWVKNKKGFYVNQQHNQGRYHSNLKFVDYGFGYKSQQNSTLFGGYLPLNEHHEIHAGLGVSKQKVTPQSVDGYSQAQYKTTSFFLASHSELNKNWLLNNSLSYHQHKGNISAEEGKDIGKVRGKQFQIETELGYKIPVKQFEITPVVGLGYQYLSVNAQDKLGENWKFSFKPYQALTAKVGSYIQLNLEKLQLSVGAFYEHSKARKNKVSITANQQKVFEQSLLGNAVVLKTEASYAFTKNIKASTQVSYRNGLSKAKLKQTHVGLQISYEF